jgi:carboxylesterase type B
LFRVSAQILGDSVMTCPSLKIADIWSATHPVYFYYFNQKITAPLFDLMSFSWTDNAAKLGTAHSTEIPYIFGMNGVLGFVLSAEQKQTQEMMQHYWANFARNGQPNAQGLLEWLPYTPNEKPFLEFRDGAQQGSDLRKVWCEYWQQNPIDFSGRR